MTESLSETSRVRGEDEDTEDCVSRLWEDQESIQRNILQQAVEYALLL